MALMTPKHVETLKYSNFFSVKCAFVGIVNKLFSQVSQNKRYQETYSRCY